MNDDVRLRGIDRELQLLRVVSIDDGRGRAKRLQGRRLRFGTRRADHIVSGFAQQHHQTAADNAGGAGEKDLHGCFYSRDVMVASSSAGTWLAPDRHFQIEQQARRQDVEHRRRRQSRSG